MKFEEKLQELRKNRGITQEELAKQLFVSRTAISKWESGRGYPSIESLKQIADFYHISIDKLLSNDELLSLVNDEKKDKNRQNIQLIFGLLDILLLVLFFLPFFGETKDGIIISVALINLSETYLYILIPYYISITLSVVLGLSCLITMNMAIKNLTKWLIILSLALNFFETLFFMITHQPYAGSFVLILIAIKGILLFKTSMTR